MIEREPKEGKKMEILFFCQSPFKDYVQGKALVFPPLPFLNLNKKRSANLITDQALFASVFQHQRQDIFLNLKNASKTFSATDKPSMSRKQGKESCQKKADYHRIK